MVTFPNVLPPVQVTPPVALLCVSCELPELVLNVLALVRVRLVTGVMVLERGKLLEVMLVLVLDAKLLLVPLKLHVFIVMVVLVVFSEKFPLNVLAVALKTVGAKASFATELVCVKRFKVSSPLE